MSDKLSHLSEKETQDLIERYYNREKVSDLIKEFNISLKPSQLVKPRQSRDYYSWNKQILYVQTVGTKKAHFSPVLIVLK